MEIIWMKQSMCVMNMGESGSCTELRTAFMLVNKKSLFCLSPIANGDVGPNKTSTMTLYAPTNSINCRISFGRLKVDVNEVCKSNKFAVPLSEFIIV